MPGQLPALVPGAGTTLPRCLPSSLLASRRDVAPRALATVLSRLGELLAVFRDAEALRRVLGYRVLHSERCVVTVSALIADSVQTNSL